MIEKINELTIPPTVSRVFEIIQFYLVKRHKKCLLFQIDSAVTFFL